MRAHWQAQCYWRAQRYPACFLVVALCGACHGAPPSQFPTGQAALDRMHATLACSRGIQGEAELDYFGEEGRVTGSVLRSKMVDAARR